MPDADLSAFFRARAERMAEASLRYAATKDEREHREQALAEAGQPGRWREFDEPERVKQRLRFRGQGWATEYLELNNAFPPELGGDVIPRPAAASLRKPRWAPVGKSMGPPAAAPIAGSKLLSSDFLIGGERARRTVARVLTNYGAALGSGFLVGPQLLMTNRHVLPNHDVAARAEAQFDFVEPSDPARGAALAPQRHVLDPDFFFHTSKDKDLDYAIVGVRPVSREGTSLGSRGWTPLLGRSGKALVGEPVNIIQHPRGQEQKVALRDNALCNVLDKFLHYRADTHRGSSGSPVWSDEWHLVALHAGGIGPLNEKRAIVMRDGEPWNGSPETEDQVAWIANEGVRVSRIVADLRAALPAMAPRARGRLEVCMPSPDEEHEDDGKRKRRVTPVPPLPPLPPRPPVGPRGTGDPTAALDSWSALDSLAFGR